MIKYIKSLFVKPREDIVYRYYATIHNASYETFDYSFISNNTVYTIKSRILFTYQH